MARTRTWDFKRLGPLDPIFKSGSGGAAFGALSTGNSPYGTTVTLTTPVEMTFEVLTPTIVIVSPAGCTESYVDGETSADAPTSYVDGGDSATAPTSFIDGGDSVC